jgi:uncharacterized membrane protein (DUF2068 family)
MFIKFGVMVVSVVALTIGALGLLIGGLVVLAGTEYDLLAQRSRDSLEAMGGYALIVIGIVAMIFGALQIIFGIGLWRLATWAWIAGVIIQSFSLITAVLGLFTGAAIPASLVTIVVSGAFLTFLLMPHVRGAFDRRKPKLAPAEN